jgi:L-2,4-diaminobutyrate decarboxylase
VARAAYEYCSASDVLEPVHEPHSNILCFRLRRLARREASDSRHWAVKEALNESGFGYLSSAVVDGRRALRMVVMNPRTTATDVRQVLQRVERLSR